MIRKKKLFKRPKKLYQKERINDENQLMEKYALKNKREIWKTLAKVNYFRSRAKELANRPIEEQELLFTKLKKLGLKVNSISDILALKIEDILQRRLSTIVAEKGFAKTSKHARQLITHNKILISGNIVNIPSYILPVEEEKDISLKEKKLNKEVKEEK